MLSHTRVTPSHTPTPTLITEITGQLFTCGVCYLSLIYTDVIFISADCKLRHIQLQSVSVLFNSGRSNRRLRGDQIEVFKILNGYENIDRNIFFTVKEERRTRGHGVTLAKKQCRLDSGKFSFSLRTVNEWNRLSADCVGASSVNIFKNKIDIYLRRAGYT